jgi:integrase
MKVELTDRWLKALRPGTPTWKKVWTAEDGGTRSRPVVFDTVVPSFGVRPTEKGKRTFVLVRRFPGSTNPTPREIGEYGAITLDAARARARDWIELVQRGVDPAEKEERERSAQQARQADSFLGAFELFVSTHLMTLRTGKEVEATMRRVLVPAWGKKALPDITRKDRNDVVWKLHDGGSPISANRMHAYVARFFAWCVERGKLEVSPVAGMKKPAKERSRDRVLTDSEIAAVWRACGKMGPFGAAVRFMIVTAARKSEVAEATWQEIDHEGRTWTLARERTKSDRAHVLALSDLALHLLDEIRRHGDFIFTTTGRGPLRGWSKAKRKLDQIALAEHGAAFPEWHLHDLRRTAATGMAKLGTDRVTIGRVLNHAQTGGGITAIYDRYGREPEVRAALETWGRRLEQIVTGASGAVVPMRRRRT